MFDFGGVKVLGAVVLERLEDAKTNRDRVFAVVKVYLWHFF